MNVAEPFELLVWWWRHLLYKLMKFIFVFYVCDIECIISLFYFWCFISSDGWFIAVRNYFHWTMKKIMKKMKNWKKHIKDIFYEDLYVFQLFFLRICQVLGVGFMEGVILKFFFLGIYLISILVLLFVV